MSVQIVKNIRVLVYKKMQSIKKSIEIMKKKINYSSKIVARVPAPISRTEWRSVHTNFKIVSN